MTGTVPNTVGTGDFAVFLLKFEEEKYLRFCKNEARMTPCIKKYLDKTYGTNYTSKFERSESLVISTFNGEKDLEKETGCLKTCYNTLYDLTQFRKFDIKYFSEPKIKTFLKTHNDTVSPTIMINHQKSNKIIQHEEVLEYDLAKFVSDSGGTVGIFVGLSFWSIFVDFISPVIEWIENQHQNKKSY